MRSLTLQLTEGCLKRSDGCATPGIIALSAYYAFFKIPTINSSKAAPAVAVITEPIKPSAEMPSKPNTKPPTIAPITPTTILPSRPKPPPFIKAPANQPAMAPMAKNIINPVISML